MAELISKTTSKQYIQVKKKEPLSDVLFFSVLHFLQKYNRKLNELRYFKFVVLGYFMEQRERDLEVYRDNDDEELTFDDIKAFKRVNLQHDNMFIVKFVSKVSGIPSRVMRLRFVISKVEFKAELDYSQGTTSVLLTKDQQKTYAKPEPFKATSDADEAFVMNILSNCNTSFNHAVLSFYRKGQEVICSD